MNLSIQNKKCVVQCRVSSLKQSSEGESLERQEESLRRFALDRGWAIVPQTKEYPQGKVWGRAISGRKTNRDDFEEVLTFIKENPGLVNYYVFKSIDRFTRAGTGEYDRMKKELLKYGVVMIDTLGVIQPSINTLEELGFEYDWSRFYPSEITENVLATTSKQEVTTILHRMIGQEIRLAQQGYRTRSPSDGYKNEKIFVEGKKKTIQVPNPNRAQFYRAMFDLRARGLTDEECVAQVNAMGFQSPIRNRWNKEHTEIIAKRGGKPLNIKQFQRYIENPIYAGVMCELWTHFKPIKAQYDGLVSIDLWNRANRGKLILKQASDGSFELIKRSSKTGEVRVRNNPLYPFKFLLCPSCSKPFLGSASRGKSGKKFPAYHCSRKHKGIRIPKADFEKAVNAYISNLKFQPDVLNALELVFMNKYRQREKEIVKASGDIHRNIADLEAEQATKLDVLVTTKSAVVREKLEREIEESDKKIKEAQGVRHKIQISRHDIKAFIKDARYVMEHPAELLLNPDDPRSLRDLFGLVFEKMPTYPEIVSGTPKLSLVFELSSGFVPDKNLMVTSRGIEPRLQP
ncbi:MAG: NUDIX hydrolase [Parcubacteria group bacterium Gr01-1014_46]|nr:MAG: NUDIX hydrolase [Parcubacteria group bacterium Gr01-1014_46]